MKKIALTLFLLMSIWQSTYAQSFEGIANYIYRKPNMKIDSTHVSDPEQLKLLRELHAKNSQLRFELLFTREASLYQEVKEEVLDKPNLNKNARQMTFVDNTAKEIVFKDLTNNQYTSQFSWYGKLFLVQDTIPKLDWQFHSETKTIGNYTCYKATRDLVSETTVQGETKKSNTQIVAWYTTDIPINTGPGRYGGLPGLILELYDGFSTTICTEIILNPKTPVTIEIPDKGKEISQEEFNKLRFDKLNQIKERMKRKSIQSKF